MGLFRDSTARTYLRSAPRGQRKDLLVAACMNQIARLPVAAADEFGEPVTDNYGLEPAAEVVRDILIQDRSMYAWLARTSLVFLDSALTAGDGDWLENLDTAMAAVGFHRSNKLRADLERDLPDHVKERVTGLHGYCMNIFFVVAQPQFDDDRDRRLYRHMFESSDARTALTAHDIAAWAAVVLGRLRNRGLLATSSLHATAYDNVPPMHQPGWYPNPYNYGDIVHGEPDFQRYWDGDDWTDRVRFLVRGRWDEQRHSLRTMPNN